MRQEECELLCFEVLERVQLGRAVDPHARRRHAPPLSADAHVRQVGELLALEEVCAHVGHNPFDSRLVGRRSDTGCINLEAP